MIADLRVLTDTELDGLRQQVWAEQQRRMTLATVGEELDRIAHVVQDSEGNSEGDDWVQPTTVGYPRGWPTIHKGKRWVSTTPNNVWEPGVSGWRESPADGAPAPYRQPTGAHDAYRLGERITWTDGRVYAATRNGVAHSPTESPRDWELVAAETGPDPEPEPEPDPEPTPEPAHPAWAPGVAYTRGQHVTHNGVTYRIGQAHTSQAHFPPSGAGLTALYAPVAP